MKKSILIIFFLLFYNSVCLAQYYSIEFEQITEAEHIGKSFLIVSDSLSWYEDVANDESKKNITKFVKDYKKKFLFFRGGTFGVITYVKDTLHNMNWVLTNEKKTILGYACQSAKTSFRGRDYKAYYAPEIAIPEGPWKFGGLPGMILEIASEDNFIAFNAKKISKTSIALKSSVNLSKRTFISWPEYVKVYKIDYDNDIIMKKTSEENIRINAHGSIKIVSIERIYKELEEGDGLTY